MLDNNLPVQSILQLTVRRIQMFYNLKSFTFQGDSSLKISARWGSPFWRGMEQTNRQTDSLI